MFSHQTDISNFDNMQCCVMYKHDVGCDPSRLTSRGVNQNSVVPKPEIWPQQPNVSFDDKFNNLNQNAVITQNISNNHCQNIKNSPVAFNSWRKEASVADWEAYLYSPTSHPVKTVPQIPEDVVTDNTALLHSNEAKYIPPKATPRAHITFVHNNGVFKPIVKRKRKRTTFTTEQVETLESIFYKRPYVSREERQALMEKLQVSDKAIKVWFQNRRLKVKKEREEQEMESSDSETIDAQNPMSLAYVEAQMYKADKFGYVTLDDRAVSELVNVIDNFLPRDTDLGNSGSEKYDSINRSCSVSESECSVIYEPISPPDLSDSTSQEFSQKWEAFEAIEPKKSLQNLLDVHNMYDCNETKIPVF